MPLHILTFTAILVEQHTHKNGMNCALTVNNNVALSKSI